MRNDFVYKPYLAVCNDGAAHGPFLEPVTIFAVAIYLQSFGLCLNLVEVKSDCRQVEGAEEYKPHTAISAVQGWDEGNERNQPAHSEQEHAGNGKYSVENS